MQHVHFIGIGGSGLSAIALVLLENDILVSGSDRQLSPTIVGLQLAGATFYGAHQAANVAGADLVVRSSAVPDDNVEVQAAVSAGIPVLKRSEFFTEFFKARPELKVLAVAGTHGKTTTTSMLAWVLSALGEDPSFIIGGFSTNLGKNAYSGKGPYFVIEADEYDRMFLGLKPHIAVVTNIEHDHPDCYPTMEDFHQAFRDFASAIDPSGTLVACGDDPGAVKLQREAASSGFRICSYGTSNPLNEYQAQNLNLQSEAGYSFDVMYVTPSNPDLPAASTALKIAQVSLAVPGLHNVRNALAVLAVVDRLGLAVREAGFVLGRFQGTNRRFEVRGEIAGVTIIDDYAHHPTEIRATLAAARQRYPGRPIWAVWQPHTYSRTRALFNDFTNAFGDADHILVTEIFAAHEPAPADGFSSRQLVSAIQARNHRKNLDIHFAADLGEARSYLIEHLNAGDVLLVLSAGDADQISTQLLLGLKD